MKIMLKRSLEDVDDIHLGSNNPGSSSNENAGKCPDCGHPLVWRKATKTGELYRGGTNFDGGCRYNKRSY